MSAVRWERQREDALLRIVIEQPPGNIFTAELMRALLAPLRSAPELRALRLITLETAGQHFSYGASVEEHTPERVDQMLPVLRELVMTIAESPVPVAALVQGRCLGGAFEAVLACHLVFATEDARFGLPEIRLGVFPPVAAAMLPRRIPQAIAERMILTGAEFTAAEMHCAGLVHEVCPDAQLHERAQAFFEGTLGRFSGASLREAVRASRRRLLYGLEEELIAQEQAYLGRLAEVADSGEGIRAFLERRKPEWSHA
jgi:cyclohexa-1,5-dienecarbonyl-CoA hydratase